eukprot:3809978-Rhodomonas_salina.1
MHGVMRTRAMPSCNAHSPRWSGTATPVARREEVEGVAEPPNKSADNQAPDTPKSILRQAETPQRLCRDPIIIRSGNSMSATAV